MKTIKLWLVTIAALLCSGMANAYDFEADGIRYDITSFTEFTVKASSVSESIIGELSVPSKVQFSGKELYVTEIGNDFAVSNQAISSLTINDGIIFIGDRAFKNCSNLTTINIAQSVLQLGCECFYGCTSLEKFHSKSIDSLGVKSFAECINLKEVSIENLVSLTEGAFANCEKLAECQLPKITSIGKEAFRNCQSLDSYNIPNGVKCIGEASFEGCSSLISMVIPNNIEELGLNTFKDCTALTSITIGAGLLYLPWVFEGCANLLDIRIEDSPNTLTVGYSGEREFESNYDGEYIRKRYSFYYFFPAMFAGKDLRNVYIGRNLTTEAYCFSQSYQGGDYGLYYSYYLPNPPFSGSNITALTIGSFVDNLRMCDKEGEYDYYAKKKWSAAFQNCTNLESVIFHSRRIMTSIPENTFSGCYRISSLDIPDNVEEIGANAFANCKGLKTLCLGDDLTTIGANAFEGCDSLIEINIKALNPPTYETGFSSTCYINTKVNVLKGNLEKYQEAEPWKNFWNLSDDLITSFEVDGINYSVINDSDVVITGNSISTLTDLLIKAKVECYGNIYNVVSIESGAFKGCTHLSSVQIEDGIERIGNAAFDGCGNLKKIIISASVTSIGFHAFSECNNLTSIFIPEDSKLASIEAFAFYRCKCLTEIILPANVGMIEHGIFSGCSKLASIVVAEGNVVYDSRENCNAVIETSTNTLVASCPNTFIPNSVTNIGFYAFSECNNLTSIAIPNSVTSIDDKAFYDCSGLASITIPNSVISIGVNVFSGCTKLKKLIFEDGDKPLIFPNGSYDTVSGAQQKSVNGKRITFKIKYYRGFFYGLPIEQLYIGRNLSNQSRYTISENVDGVDYLITSYDAPFSNLSQLKELIIGENVGVLGPEQEDIPEVEHYITPGSFKYCSSLQTINVKNTTPPMGAEFTNDVYSNAQVIVPKGTVSAYKEADGWKEFSYLQEKVEQYNLTFKIGDEVYLTKKVTEGEKNSPARGTQEGRLHICLDRYDTRSHAC